jgi:protein gp37
MTRIEWTDQTWNPTTGCKEISPGCANCYAARLAATRLSRQSRYRGLAVLGDNGRPHWTGEVRLHPGRLHEPLRWRKPRKVFVCDMSDLFHADVPDWFLRHVFEVMRLCPQHTFQVLTKRPERMQSFLSGADCLPLKNAWLGVSVEDQQRADERIPYLLRTPAALRFLSCEPLLGPVNLHRYLPRSFDPTDTAPDGSPADYSQTGVDWVIAGGESGPLARPCRLEWLRSLVRQCQEANVPCFVKQFGSLHRLRDRKGADPSEWPEDLRIRQWPHGVNA